MRIGTADDQEMRDGLELRIELARTLRDLRANSRYQKNLSAAARAAGITPSYLHRIEGGEALASAECYVNVCRAYGVSPLPILKKLGKLDADSERLLLRHLDTHWGLVELALSVPPKKVEHAKAALHAIVRDSGDEQRTP